MAMPNRTDNSPSYRYGFNGKEKDESGEWGDLTHYDYGFRIYNPGIARFLSVDPLTASYPWYTPYQFAGNKPIFARDLDGLEEDPAIEPVVAVTPILVQPVEQQVKKTVLQRVGQGAMNYVVKPAVGTGLATLSFVLMPTTSHAPTPNHLITITPRYENLIDDNPIQIELPEAMSTDNTEVAPDPEGQIDYEGFWGPEFDERKEKKVVYLYRTIRSHKKEAGFADTELPYYGITDKPNGRGRYKINSKEALNMRILAKGTRFEMEGAETAIILLNNEGDPSALNVLTGTRIDNKGVSTSNPASIKAGEQALNAQDPGWQIKRLEKDQGNNNDSTNDNF